MEALVVCAVGCIRSEYVEATEALAGAATAICIDCYWHCVTDSCPSFWFGGAMVGRAERFWKSEAKDAECDFD